MQSMRKKNNVYYSCVLMVSSMLRKKKVDPEVSGARDSNPGYPGSQLFSITYGVFSPVVIVCVSSMLSGLKTRSLGLNTLGTT